MDAVQRKVVGVIVLPRDLLPNWDGCCPNRGTAETFKCLSTHTDTHQGTGGTYRKAEKYTGLTSHAHLQICDLTMFPGISFSVALKGSDLKKDLSQLSLAGTGSWQQDQAYHL